MFYKKRNLIILGLFVFIFVIVIFGIRTSNVQALDRYVKIYSIHPKIGNCVDSQNINIRAYSHDLGGARIYGLITDVDSTANWRTDQSCGGCDPYAKCWGAGHCYNHTCEMSCNNIGPFFSNKDMTVYIYTRVWEVRSATMEVILDHEAPLFSDDAISVSPFIKNPHTGELQLSGTVSISASTTDDGCAGIKGAKIFIKDLSEKVKYLNTKSASDPKNFTFQWLWDTKSVDDGLYEVEIYVYDNFWDHNKERYNVARKTVRVNNAYGDCDQDGDGYIPASNCNATCKDIVCGGDSLCLDCGSNPDCNDDPASGEYARPYDLTFGGRESRESEGAEGEDSAITTFGPACDDGLDNDCDDGYDYPGDKHYGGVDFGTSYTGKEEDGADSNCVETCDKDGDGHWAEACLNCAPDDRACFESKNGDCDDDDDNVYYGFEESTSSDDCLKVNCCCDGKDNDCDGGIDECCYVEDCDVDGDKYLNFIAYCSPPDAASPPPGFLGFNDCNDNDANIYPGKKETEYSQGCNGEFNNNCDDIFNDKNDQDCIDLCDVDLDGWFNGANPVCGNGIYGDTCGGKGCDCYDVDPSVDPRSSDVNPWEIERTKEQCEDGLDNDCDGLIDGDDPGCQAAAGARFVPCGGPGQPDCTLCHLFVMAKAIIDWVLLYLIFPLGAVVIVGGGILLMTAAGSQARVATAKQMITYAVIGIVVILIAWVIVNTILTFFGAGFLQNWSEINCPV